MKSNTRVFLGALCLLALLASSEPVAKRAMADDKGGNAGLEGSWAFQLTGTVFLPPPFDAFNGPFYRNGRFVADGHGNLQVTASVFNYNGTVGREPYSGTYSVNEDGTFTLQFTNLPVPFLPPDLPTVFSFDGVLARGGTVAKVVLSGVNVGGQQLPNIGSIVAGEFVKQ